MTKIKPKLVYPLYSPNVATDVDLQSEIDNRTAADTSLAAVISTEIYDRTSADASLTTAINAGTGLSIETSQRISADSSLSSIINTKYSISGGTIYGIVGLSTKLYASGLTSSNQTTVLGQNPTTKEITLTSASSLSVNYATTAYQMVDTDSGTYVYLTNPISSQVWFTNDSDYDVCCDYATIAGTLGGYNFQYFNSPYQNLTSGSTVTINCSLSTNYILTTSSSAFTISLSNYLNGTRGTIILNLSASSTKITISNTPTAYKNGTFTGLTSGKYLLEFWTDNNLYAMWRIAKYT
jgi:hypothetical protein